MKAEFLAKSEISINREVEYIRRCAAGHDSRCVTLDALAFFSTESGDAWMLDPDDGLALCLARDSVALPVRILQTDSSTVVEWNRTYSIEGDRFCTTEKKTGRVTTIVGYPTQAILTAIQDAREAQAKYLGGNVAEPGAPAERPRD